MNGETARPVPYLRDQGGPLSGVMPSERYVEDDDSGRLSPLLWLVGLGLRFYGWAVGRR